MRCSLASNLEYVGAAAGKQPAEQLQRAFRTAALYSPSPADGFSPQQLRMEQPNTVNGAAEHGAGVQALLLPP